MAEDMSMLRESAKALGGSTKFTATEVAGLQKNLAKLGFTTEEILNSTNAILGLAAATGEDLAKSAEVAGSVLRAFSLDTTEMTRVVDTMTASFSGSALDLEKFSTSMRSVAPVANAFGFSIEETTALLGTLTNAGFDASQAGTALRNILLNLANTNGALAKELGGTVNTFDEFIPALIELKNKNVDLNRVLEITDKRSVAAFLRFLDGAEAVREFKDEIVAAKGVTDEMSKKQLDTLKGDLTILKSAWEGLTISVRDGGEANDATRGIIQGLTTSFQGLTPEMSKMEKLSEQMVRIEKRLFLDVVTGGIGVLKNLGLTIFGVNKKREDSIEIVETLTTRESELADQLARMARVRSRNEIIAEYEAKLAEEREVARKASHASWLKDQLERNRLIKEESDYQKQVTKDNILMQDEIVESESDSLDEQINNDIKLFNQKFTTVKQFGQAKQQEVDDEKKADQEALQFQEQAFQMGLAGLDAFAQERGLILNAQVLADQVRGIASTMMALGVGVANTAKIGFPQNIPMLIGFAGQVAGLIGTLKSIKVGTTKYAEGGSGELGSEGTTLRGERHSSGGVNLGEIGEGEKGEYFGIISRGMTQRYKQDLPQVFETLNKGTFHNVYRKSNELHSSVSSTQDPYTKKMYNLMKNQPAVYNDSDGNQVLLWPTGKKRVIRA